MHIYERQANYYYSNCNGLHNDPCNQSHTCFPCNMEGPRMKWDDIVIPSWFTMVSGL